MNNTGVAKAIQKSLNRLIGHYCWNAYYERMLNLDLNFGPPRLRVREPHETTSRSPRAKEFASCRLVRPKGTWWFWLRMASWTIRRSGKKLASFSSSQKDMKRAFMHLNGQKLRSFHIHPDTGRTRLTFDLGGELDIRRFEKDSVDELWILYEPNGYCLSVYGNGTYDHNPGSGSDCRPAIRGRKITTSARTKVGLARKKARPTPHPKKSRRPGLKNFQQPAK